MSQPTRILVVDDDPAILQFFATLLRTQGYEVREAATARQGLRLTREQQPDLVLLDIRLPDLSGLEVCRQIKADAALQDVFVVLISGRADGATPPVEGLATGADDYLTRPVEGAEFLARIRTMLRLRQATTALRAGEQHYRHLLEILPDAFGLISPDGRLLSVNPQAVGMLGYAEAAELLQKNIFDLFPAHERDRIKAELHQTLETGFLRNGQYELLKKDGHLVPVEVSASVMKDSQGCELGIVCVVRDITERKQAERIQRESDARFQELAENIREVFWISDPAKNQIHYVSPAYEEIWGQSSRSLYASPRDWIQAIHPDDRQRVLAAALTRQAAGEYDEVYRIVRPDGSLRWIQDRAFAVRDESGTVCRIVGVATDVTRQKEAEQSLRESEARYRQLAESSPDAIYILDRAAVVQYVNPVAAQWFNATDLELLGRTQAELFSPEAAQQHERLVRHVFETGEVMQREERIAFRQGHKWVEVRLVPIRARDGQVMAVMGISRDLTERKRLEEQTRLLADAVESSGELICITDVENRLTFANQAFLSASGYTLAEILGRTPAFLYSPNNVPGLSELVYQESLKGGWRGEILIHRKDGSELPVSLCTSRILNDDGKHLGLVGVARDITQRKRAERQNAACSLLVFRLSAATDTREAAQIILDVASDLFGWDAGYVGLYSAHDDRIIPILTVDTVDGERRAIAPKSLELNPSPLMRQVMAGGPRLTHRDEASRSAAEGHPFGDVQRNSESMMHVPIRPSGKTIGILSIQSYKPRAYTQADLQLLQTLADHGGDALDRIRMTDALRAAEAKYRSIFENSIEGIYQSTPEGRYLSVNPAMARILGYETPEEVLRSITDIARQVFVRPERREEFKRLVESLGSIDRFESEHRRKDGSKFWMSVNARAVRDANGRVVFYEGTALDTTELKWAEHVRQVQRDFGIFLSSVNDLKTVVERLLMLALQHEGIDCGAVYLVIPTDARLELVAHQGLSAQFAERAFGVQAAGVRPAPPQHPDGTMVALVEQLEQEGLRAREVLPLQHKGRVVAVLSLGSHALDEIPIQSLHAVDAIAAMAGGAIARIRAEKSLQEHQQLLEKALHSLSVAVFILDAEPVIIRECNPAATKIFGYTREELIGRSPALLHPNQAMREQYLALLLATVKRDGYLKDFEYAMRRKDGTLFPTEHHVMPIKDETGRVIHWVGVIRDLTEAKRTEEELRLLSRRIIAAQETERQRVARELHDGVNQVIASAKMRLHSVEQSVAAQFPATREILARCGRLLVQALEENRRIAHNLRPADLDQLGLATACRNCCREFQARTGLAVKCHIGRQVQSLPPAVELNLFRIIQESLNNVEHHARAKSVRLRLTVQDGCLILKIQDDGRGLEAGRRKAAKGKPRGIGLANMRERAAAVGGTCEVKSGSKHGTTITVRVPSSKAK